MITVVSLANLKHPRDAVRAVKRPNTDVSLDGIAEFAYEHFGLLFEDLLAYNHPFDILPNPVDWQVHEFWHFIGMLRKTVEASGHKPILVLKPTGADREDEIKWFHLLNRFWLGKRDLVEIGC